MATTTESRRAPEAATDRLGRALGRPVAFAATAALLLGLFGWSFFLNPDRVAPTKDPAYYTWRTEALISEPPERLLELEGALGMFEGGYRVAAPLLGSYLRQVADVSSLRTTVFLMVLLPVGIALLLGGFAYRHRRDPLIFHAVALGAGSLLLTPPFVGYLDNMLSLFFLAASLFFLDGLRTRPPARVAFGLFLLLAGLTHPTTLAIFGMVLGLMAAAKFVVRRFDLRSVVAEDGPMLLTALSAAVVTALVWTVGIWGKSASFSESALPPPYGSDFFVDRMVQWVDVMRPAINGPLFAVGIVGVLAVGRRAVDDTLSRTSILWLAPLVGLFGFVGGLTYPYYRFFNTTLAWVLLVGLGLYFVIGFLQRNADGSGRRWLVALGALILAAVVIANFSEGYERSRWNDLRSGWLSSQTKADLDTLRSHLAATDEERPVIFVIDDEPGRPFQIWGHTKLSGNTSRYGLPHGQVDQGYVYLGSLENYLAGEPTFRDQETYDEVSPALLEEARAAIEETGERPIVVVASAFNPAGANAGIAQAVVAGESVDVPEAADPTFAPAELVALHDGTLVPFDGTSSLIGTDPVEDRGTEGFLHLLVVLFGLAVLLAPGYLALRWVLPDATIADGLGLVPALAMTILTVVGLVVLAVVREPFSAGLAWLCAGIAIVATGVVAARTRKASA